MKKAGVAIDRKILSELALALPGDFAAVVKAARA
jgi:large subunit ribosomal protein L20